MIIKCAVGLLFISVIFLLPGPAGGLCVKVPTANVRSGPGKGYDLVWQVYQYMPFERVGTSSSGGWYAVRDVDGDVNWIHKALLTNSFECGVVKGSEVNVRRGPGARYGKASWGPAREYDSFRVLRRSGQWVKVKDELGGIGWIHKKFLWMK